MLAGAPSLPPTDPVLFASPDFDLLEPPGYPETLTLYTHARWRFDPLDETGQTPTGARGPSWTDCNEFRRWLATRPDVPADPGEGEDGTRGMRNAHMLLRHGQPPKLGWSSYKKLFRDVETPVRLSVPQREAGEQMTLLRTIDFAILSHRDLPTMDAARVRRLVVMGLPAHVATVPTTRQANKLHGILRDKLDFNGWTLEMRETVVNRNPAAFLSGCYLAPIIGSPEIPHKAARPSMGMVDRLSGGEEMGLIREMGEALHLRDTAHMAEIFSRMVSMVHQMKETSSVPTSQLPDPSEEEDLAAEGNHVDLENHSSEIRSRRPRGR